MPRVEVRWIDSHFLEGWRTVEQWDEEFNNKDGEYLKCNTTGYLFREDELLIAIAQNASFGGQVGEIMCIPKIAIIDISYLTEMD